MLVFIQLSSELIAQLCVLLSEVAQLSVDLDLLGHFATFLGAHEMKFFIDA
jgi:hypothetical protein